MEHRVRETLLPTPLIHAQPSLTMDDDLIVVDDFDDTGPLSNGESQAGPSAPRTTRGMGTRHSTRPRNTPDYAAMQGDGVDEDGSANVRETRSTRASGLRPRFQPKLKLKLSEKAAAQAPGMSFLGPFDRELDSDDEDLAFEEQFILRMPPGEDCDKLRQMVTAREVTPDVWFKFKGQSCTKTHLVFSTDSCHRFSKSRIPHRQ